MSLTDKKCIPCEGGTPPLAAEQIADYQAQLPELWETNDTVSISKQFTFKNFRQALSFTNKVGQLAETENHHPDILIHNYKHVTITLTTHAIDGLSENDFILAAKISALTTSNPTNK